jgi:hypothetical protein
VSASPQQEAMRTAVGVELGPLGVSDARIAGIADRMLATLIGEGWALVSTAEAEGDAPGRRE